MKRFNLISQISAFLTSKKQYKIGFVPTMGSLHEGHESLIKRCQLENDITIVSIYVNPIQFNNQDDFINYPRDLNSDIKKLNHLKCDVVFCPSNDEMIREDCPETNIELGNLNKLLEAQKRPGHFKGVLTIVSKLFQIISPHRAYFGEKDLQQLLIIKRLAFEKFNQIEIVGCKTIRDEHGLAQSSRNQKLNDKELKLARLIHKALLEVKGKITIFGLNKTKMYIENYFNKISEINLDYFEIIDSESFSFTNKLNSDYSYYAMIAVQIGKIRLIDNLKL